MLLFSTALSYMASYGAGCHNSLPSDTAQVP